MINIILLKFVEKKKKKITFSILLVNFLNSQPLNSIQYSFEILRYLMPLMAYVNQDGQNLILTQYNYLQ